MRAAEAKQGTDGGVILELKDVSYRNVVRGISLKLKRGEIDGRRMLAILGLAGASNAVVAPLAPELVRAPPAGSSV